MDKNWMSTDRRSHEYQLGVAEFLDFASKHTNDAENISCPCTRCGNGKLYSVDIIKYHLFANGIDKHYTRWIWHGESSRHRGINRQSRSTDVDVDFGEPAVKVEEGIEGGADGGEGNNVGEQDEGGDQNLDEGEEFLKFVKDGDEPLYPGCSNFTKLTALVESYNLKVKFGMSDANYNAMLEMVGDFLPKDHKLPGSCYEAKKNLRCLGMDYIKIHACPNDCMLYRGEYKDLYSCPICGISRWKLEKNNKEKLGVPAKVLWYFPPIPRFRRMFQSTKTAKDLTWHAIARPNDGMMRHPSDSPTWKMVDEKWPDFASDPRNLRLALSSDGFNPFTSLSSKYSCWPVILATYNLPPWLCMKRKFMMLTLLISGPKQPGHDIDIYLQPLIDDLKLLWEGVDRVYDAYRGQYFKLRAALFWTISDYPAYGNLSGSVVHGYKACVICAEGGLANRLHGSQKQCWFEHRRWLPEDHPSRKRKAAFNGEEELRKAPVPLTGEEVWERVKDMPGPGGKTNPPPTNKGIPKEQLPCWKKKSIFFELDYWKYIPIRHNLDLMHIEKNGLESLLGTLLNIKGKTKDSLGCRIDCEKIRPKLVPKDRSKRAKLPLASWNLTKDEKKIVCKSFFNMKPPSRFCSNIRSLVNLNTSTISGMKSHDCHTIMQLLLPVAIRSVLEKPVRNAITRFCLFFKAICSKVVDVSKLKRMQEELVVTVCELEKYFPPSFFDIMIHLTVHVVREVELCGPVFFRWMYPFERYMKVFKGYVRNQNCPEGCIAEAYLCEEALQFCCNNILEEDETVGVPYSGRFGEFVGCRPMSGVIIKSIYDQQIELAHLCVLENTDEARPYFDEHMEILKQEFPKFKKDIKWLKEKQNKIFASWLKDKVRDELDNPENQISETMRWLADGPSHEVPSYHSYMVDGVQYNTKNRDSGVTVQNSGVYLLATSMQVSSAKDKNPIVDLQHFYGVITSIWDLDYHNFRVPIFKCDWVEPKSIKNDDHGYTLVNLNRLCHKTDPFVLATHVKQVFYIEAPESSEWSVVLHCPDRDYRHHEEELGELQIEKEGCDVVFPPIEDEDMDEGSHYMRDTDELMDQVDID